MEALQRSAATASSVLRGSNTGGEDHCGAVRYTREVAEDHPEAVVRCSDHCFGMVMANLGSVTHGACMVIPSPAFEPEATLEAVAEERCTSLYGVPTMFIAELEHPDFDSFDL